MMVWIHMGVEFLEHTADVRLRITAGGAEELLAEAARGFYAVLLAEDSRGRIEAREERRVDLEAPDGEAVLVDFLNELIWRFDAEKLLLPFVKVEEARLTAGEGRVRATLAGERFDPARHALATQVKAATYRGLRMVRSGGDLAVEVILDL